MTLGDRLKEARKRKGLTQEELGALIGVQKAAIHKYENNVVVNLKRSTIHKLAKALDVTPTYLLELEDTKWDSNIEPAQFDRNVVKIPVFPAVPAGTPIEALNDIIDWEEIPAKWLVGGKEYFGVVVKGNSMYPYYMEGDIVIVCKQPVCECGDDCIVYVNGYEATLKQVKLHEDGSMTLQPLNPEYAPRTYTPEEISSLPVMICGVVKELRRTRK